MKSPWATPNDPRIAEAAAEQVLGKGAFPHPETGELISTAGEFFKALADVEERLAPLYRTRSSLQAAYAERHGVAALPERRRRTQTQELVAKCPRCRQVFSMEEEDAA